LQAVIDQGGLVSMLAPGTSASPKNARDLTLFDWTGIKPQSSQVARITAVSHQCPARPEILHVRSETVKLLEDKA
jgi:hypothetical protein